MDSSNYHRATAISTTTNRTDDRTTATSTARGRQRGVSVIIPTYNERENITTVTEQCLHALDETTCEIIVVDDDSPDETWRIADETFADDDRVRVLRRQDERGLATAVVTGFAQARHDYCAVIDADHQHPPERLPDLLSALDDGADIAVGSRHVEGGGIEDWSRIRSLVSSVASAIANLFVPSARRVNDPMSGFFAVRGELLEGITLSPTGYKILLEVLERCPYESVVEVPYTFQERKRGESKLDATQYQQFAEHLLMLAVESRGLNRIITPHRVTRIIEFALVGGVGAVVNMVVFMLVMANGNHHLVAGGLAFLAAVNSNFVGNWSITFDRPETGLLKTWGKFNLVSLTGFVLYTVFLTTSIEVLLLPAAVANLVAIAGSSVFNFVGAENIAFASEAIK